MSGPSDASTTSTMSGMSAISAMSGFASSMKDTFNNNGGNEMFNNVSANIPQGTKDYISNARSKFLNRENIRSVTVFFGAGEETPFFFEKNPTLLVERLKHNFSFFYLNYMLLTGVLFCLTLLISPGAIIGIALLGVAWMSVIRATQDGSCQVYGIVISQKQATMGMSVVSVFVLVFLLKNVFWWTTGSGGLLVGTHCLLRDASMHKDEEDKVEMTGDMGGGIGNGAEDAAFLNPADNGV